MTCGEQACAWDHLRLRKTCPTQTPHPGPHRVRCRPHRGRHGQTLRLEETSAATRNESQCCSDTKKNVERHNGSNGRAKGKRIREGCGSRKRESCGRRIQRAQSCGAASSTGECRERLGSGMLHGPHPFHGTAKKAQDVSLTEVRKYAHHIFRSKIDSCAVHASLTVMTNIFQPRTKLS